MVNFIISLIMSACHRSSFYVAAYVQLSVQGKCLITSCLLYLLIFHISSCCNVKRNFKVVSPFFKFFDNAFVDLQIVKWLYFSLMNDLRSEDTFA